MSDGVLPVDCCCRCCVSGGGGRKWGYGLKTAARHVVLLLLVVGLIPLGGCGQRTEFTEIDLSNREPLKPSAGDTAEVPLRIAIAGVISPTETLKAYEALVSYIGQEFRQSVEVVQRETYAEINDLVKSRYVDLAFVCSLAYVAGRDEFDMELLAVPQVDGETVYYSYIIVPVDSDARSLGDLRGKTFAFSDPLSNSGRLAPTYLLHQIGETPEDFFERYLFTYSHDNSIRAVADGIVDGAAVDSLVYEYITRHEPDIAAETRIISRSGPFGIPPVVVHPGLDPEIKARLRGLFLSLHESERGEKVLEDLMIDRFVLGEDASYDMIRSMTRELGW